MRFLLLALLLLSAASFGGTKVTPNVGSNMSILNSSNTGYLSGTNYWKQGDTVTSYMERLGRHTPIGVTPSRGVPKSRIASAVKNLIRTSPASLAASVGLMAIVEGAGWVLDELTGQLTNVEFEPIPLNTSFFHWSGSRNGAGTQLASSPGQVCAQMASALQNSTTSYRCDGVSFISENHYKLNLSHKYYQYTSWTTFTDDAYREGASCPSGTSYDNALAACASVYVSPLSDVEIDNLQIDGDADFYDGVMRDACNGSSNPSGCFDALVEQRKLEGPATVSGPKTTTTSTQTNADGSTSTVSKETQTDFDIAYGDDDFVYTPRTTTETKVDGQTTETTTEQEDTDADSEQKPEEEAVSEIAGLQCEAAVSCSGDAIQCAIAKTQKDTKCILQDAFDCSGQLIPDSG